MKREKVYTGAPWEKTVSYCRAVRVGKSITVSGTTSVDENGNVIGDNVYDQACHIFNLAEKTLLKLGSNLSFVTRTRTFIKNISHFDQFAKAHGEYFKGIDPAATCVEVSGFVNPEILIEIEFDAMDDE